MMIPLYVAAECGDIKKVEQFLAQLPQDKVPEKISQTDYRRRTALHLAVEYGHPDVAEVLINNDIDLSIMDRGGFTALHLAAELGHDKIVARMLEKSPKLVGRTSLKANLTCLHLAVIRGHVAVVRQLLAMKLGLLNVKTARGKLPLNLAMEYGREEIVTILVESVNKGTSEHELDGAIGMFQCAIRFGYDHIASKLLAQCPSLIEERFGSNKSVFHFAAECRRDSIVDQLLTHRPRLDKVGEDYQASLFHFAAEFGYDKVVSELLVEKEQLIDVEADNGKSALHLAARGGCEEVVAQFLAVRPALATQRDSKEKTALHLAAGHGRHKVVGQLLAHSPELLDAEDKQGRTALFSAVGSSDDSVEETVACLLAHGPAVTTGIFWEALHESTGQVVKALLDYKPELIEVTWSRGRSTLHVVFSCDCETGYFRKAVMRLVLQLSPPETLRKLDEDHYKDTPLHAAIRCRNEFAVKLVQEKFSLDEIVDAVAKCKNNIHHTPVFDPSPSVFDYIGDCLLESLNKDVAGTVCDFLGISAKQ